MIDTRSAGRKGSPGEEAGTGGVAARRFSRKVLWLKVGTSKCKLSFVARYIYGTVQEQGARLSPTLALASSLPERWWLRRSGAEVSLATGDSFRTIAFSFRVGVSTVCQTTPQVATAIWDCLVDDFMAVPSPGDWRSITEGF
ncbi:hypothetical protein ACER0C_003134 [Sarotherodon galilaeus]